MIEPVPARPAPDGSPSPHPGLLNDTPIPLFQRQVLDLGETEVEKELFDDFLQCVGL